VFLDIVPHIPDIAIPLFQGHLCSHVKMTIISAHLRSLIDDSNDGLSDHSRRDINEWLAYGQLTNFGILLN